MIHKKTYDLAMAYINSHIYHEMSDADVYAVSLPGDRIGYCLIMGMIGSHFSLGVYIGEEGLISLRQMLRADAEEGISPDASFELHGQTCLQCYFEQEDYLIPEVVASAKRYYDRIGYPYDEETLLPCPTSWKPRRLPVLVNKEEETDLTIALEACLYIFEHLDEFSERNETMPWNEEIPLLKKKGRTFERSVTTLPCPQCINYLIPSLPEASIMDSIRKMRPSSAMNTDASLSVLRSMVMDGLSPKDPAPYYPIMLAAMKNGFLYRPCVSEGQTDDQISDLLRQFVSQILEQDMKPELIRVNGWYAYRFLESFCVSAGISLQYQESLPELEETVDGINSTMSEPDPYFDEMFQMIEDLPERDYIMERIEKAATNPVEAEELMAELRRMLESKKKYS